MTLDKINPREYRLHSDEEVYITHDNDSCEKGYLGEVRDMKQAAELIDEHEKRWHQAKVIQMNAPHTGRTGPQRFYPL